MREEIREKEDVTIKKKYTHLHIDRYAIVLFSITHIKRTREKMCVLFSLIMKYVYILK